MVHDIGSRRRFLKITSIVLVSSLVALAAILLAQASFYLFIVGDGLPLRPFFWTWTISLVIASLGNAAEIYLVFNWRWSISRFPVPLFMMLCPLILISTLAQFVGWYDGELAYIAEKLELRTNSSLLLFSQSVLAVFGALIVAGISQITRLRLRRLKFIDA